MSATQEISEIKKIGLIAGSGMLPRCVIDDCRDRGIDVFVIAIEGQTPRELVEGIPHVFTHFGAVGYIFQTLKDLGIKDLVLAGSMKRPNLFELRPDLKALKIIGRIGFRALGDDGLLRALRCELEDEGFILHGVQKFSSQLLAKKGVMGAVHPLPEDMETIYLGLKASQVIGSLDIGQSVVVQQGQVIGVEAVEGTDALIERCASLMKTGRGGILVKTSKPQQDKELDLPTIGIQTIEKANACGLCGIIIEADHSIILDINSVVMLADRYNIFIQGIQSDDFYHGSGE